LGFPLATVRLDAVIGSFMGSTSARLRQVFDLAKHQRVVLLLDEVDALGRSRSDRSTTDVGESHRIVNSLLVMLEEIQGPSIVIAATNHEGGLDPALWRRFDEIVMFPRPAKPEALALLKRLVERYDTRLATSLSPPAWRSWAQRLSGMSFADVERLALDAVKTVAMDDSLSIETALVAALEQQRERRALTGGRRT